MVEAGAELTLKAGGSFVKVDGGGVHLVGAAINLNSGGSPGSGSGYSGKMAELPLRVKGRETPQTALLAPHSATMTSVLPTLATLDLPVTELCQKRADGSCPKANCECA